MWDKNIEVLRGVPVSFRPAEPAAPPRAGLTIGSAVEGLYILNNLVYNRTGRAYATWARPSHARRPVRETFTDLLQDPGPTFGDQDSLFLSCHSLVLNLPCAGMPCLAGSVLRPGPLPIPTGLYYPPIPPAGRDIKLNM